MVASDMAPVLAMAGGGAPFVLHWVCADELAADPSECVPMQTPLDGLKSGNALLITSAGDYVVAVDRVSRSVISYAITRAGVGAPKAEPLGGSRPARLLASLRSSNEVIGRDLDGNLVRLDPQTLFAQRIAPQHADMMLASVGEEHVIGRVVLDDENEELYLIPIPPPTGDSDLIVSMDPILLSKQGIASRIVITPRDEFVAVTYGGDDSAYTQVFRVPDGKKLQGFVGAMVSGRDELSEVPGMRAVSPDGSHLAYRTEQGSLAMRSLLSHSSCLVHSSRAGSSTRLAGFSADGVLYFETADGPGQSSVNAWTPQRKERRQLSEPTEGFLLTTVPAQPADAEGTPWAFGVRQNRYVALQAGTTPHQLDFEDAVVVPRDDANIWVLSSKRVHEGREVGLQRVVPRWSDQMRALAFDDDAPPLFVANSAPSEPPKQLLLQVYDLDRVCISTGAPGSWGYTCGNVSDDRFFSAGGTPSSETVDGNARDDAEVPVVGDVYNCGTGTPEPQSAGACNWAVNRCCFDTKGEACEWAQCGGECSEVGGEQPTVVCGPASSDPAN
jgi:hypothetical protein